MKNKKKIVRGEREATKKKSKKEEEEEVREKLK